MEFPGRGGAVVLGASGAGKSTLLGILRNRLGNRPDVVFPGRLTTRPTRKDDVPWENRSVTAAELDRLDSAGRLLLRWQKVLGPERAEHYAFPRVPPHGVGVFGGNDALIENAWSVRPSTEPLDRLRKVLVVCDPEVRRARLLARSPELLCDPVELAARLTSSPQRVVDCADLVLDNTDGFQAADLDHLERTVLGVGPRSGAET